MISSRPPFLDDPSAAQKSIRPALKPLAAAVAIGAAGGTRQLPLGEDAAPEAVAEAVQRPLDAFDVGQIGADAEDHGFTQSSTRRPVAWFTVNRTSPDVSP